MEMNVKSRSSLKMGRKYLERTRSN